MKFYLIRRGARLRIPHTTVLIRTVRRLFTASGCFIFTFAYAPNYRLADDRPKNQSERIKL